MPKYSLNSVIKAQQLEDAMTLVNQTARERLSQMFIDMYMTPGPFADAPTRLGRVVALAAEEETVSSKTFPPYARYGEFSNVTHEDLPFRLGGFKVVNDRITLIQRLLREVYGEIRTKITEWDLSLYIQELFLSDKHIPDLSEMSLLFRIKEDNPSRYRGPAAYIYGMINTAVSFERWKRWNPKLDPELRYWVSPTSSLHLWAHPPKPRRRLVTWTTRHSKGWGPWRRTYTKKHRRWVWYTPKRPYLNSLQRREVHRALAAKWTNWYPPYWKLFFWNADVNSLGDEDERQIGSRHMQTREANYGAQSLTAGSGSKFSLSRFKRARKNRSAATAEASLAASNAAGGGDSKNGGLLGKTVRSSGMNMKSPIWIGSPVGRYRDPRSLAAYLYNEANSRHIPKIAPTLATSHPINRSARHINQMEGLNRVLNGWSTRYRARRSYEKQIQVWNKGTNPDPDGETIIREYRVRHYPSHYRGVWRYRVPRYKTVHERGYWTWKTITIYYWTWIKRTGQFPDLTATMRYEKPKHIRVGQERRRSWWFWWRSFSVRSSYIPGKYILMGSILRDSAFLAKFAEKDTIPVVMLSADKQTAMTVSITRDHYIVQGLRWVRKTRRRFWRRRYTYYEKKWYARKIPCFTVHTGTMSQFTAGVTDALTIRTMTPLSLSGFLRGSTKVMRGFFFDIPARELREEDNIITDGWDTIELEKDVGTSLARIYTANVWSRGRGALLSSLPYNIRELHRRFVRVQRYLKHLATVIDSFDSTIMRALIDALPEERARLRTLVLARRRFTAQGVARYRRHVHHILENLAPFIEILVKMSSETGLTYATTQAFLNQYRRVTTLVTDRRLYSMLDSYLTILYEWRMVYLQQRLNKVDGTLTQLARIESIDIPTAEAAVPNPSIADAVAGEALQVVHKTTNVSLAQRAEALRTSKRLPTERIHYVYVPVQYTNTGEIVRHPAGFYDLLSREYMKDSIGEIDRVRFFITFEEGKAPPIVANVVTSTNPQELQQIMGNSELSMLEKICAARETQDWWKIEIPRQMRPLSKHFETGNVLMMIPEDARMEKLLALLGDLEVSPILEHTETETATTMANLNKEINEIHSTGLGHK